MSLRVLVVGDPYMPVSAYADALAGLDGRVELSTLQIDDVRFAPPAPSPSSGCASTWATRPRSPAPWPGTTRSSCTGRRSAPRCSTPRRCAWCCCARGGPVNVDVAAATERGIPVVNTPGKNAEAVAELTIAFALLLIRAVPRASRHLLDGGGFAESVFEGREFFGTEAPSLTMGLVGLGHVGREVARRARALGFTVVGHDPQPPADPGVELVSLDTLLDRSDVVSLHARLTPENRQMFGRDRFTRMRPGRASSTPPARRWSTRRPWAGRWRRACSAARPWTCWSGRRAADPLLGLPNVFVTPHIGGATAETLARGARRAVAAVADLLAGRVPADVVNPQVLQRERR